MNVVTYTPDSIDALDQLKSLRYRKMGECEIETLRKECELIYKVKYVDQPRTAWFKVTQHWLIKKSNVGSRPSRYEFRFPMDTIGRQMIEILDQIKEQNEKRDG